VEVGSQLLATAGGTGLLVFASSETGI